MAKASARVGRLFELVTLIQSGQGGHAAALAERLGVSRTQVFNDLRVLREVGVPIETTPEGYRMGDGFFLPPLDLTDSEAASLLLPSELVGPASGEGGAAQRAREKLLGSLSDESRQRARHLLRHTSVTVPPDGTRRGVLDEIRAALLEQRRVLLTMRPSCSGTSGEAREFDTYGIAFRRNTWYVVGYSARHDEVRILRIAEIEAVEATPLHYTPPEDLPPEAYC